ncbi:MAG: type II toxin-antitoxin system RelE/ParE family toxin [Pseudomonadota bacterium]
MNLIFTDEASADLDDIWSYSLQNWGAVRCAEYVEHVVETAEAIARGELSGIATPDIRPGLRRQIAGSHVIWFRAEPGLLRVVRVLHQSRDAGRWMG